MMMLLLLLQMNMPPFEHMSVADVSGQSLLHLAAVLLRHYSRLVRLAASWLLLP
jgi:hypothetical protein